MRYRPDGSNRQFFLEATIVDAGCEAGTRFNVDLDAFKLHVMLQPGFELTLHFDSPSRRFYLSLIALVAISMRAPGARKWVPMQRHTDVLVLLNETIGGRAGSSAPRTLLGRIYRKWKSALPDLAAAPLFRVLGRQRSGGRAASQLTQVHEIECDLWANLFEYRGSEESVQLRLAFERIGIDPESAVVQFGAARGDAAWTAFVAGLARSAAQGASPAHPSPLAATPPHSAPATEPRPRTPQLPDARPNVIPQAPFPAPLRKKRFAAIAAGLAIAATLGVLGLLAPRERPAAVAPHTTTAADSLSYPELAKPVIAVVPFVSLGGQANEALQAAGFTIELVAALSRVPELAVVALPGAAQSVDSTKTAASLGARHVLQGNLGRVEDRLRVSVQLVEVGAGRVQWAERFDRTIGNLFEIQDEITIQVVTALQGTLSVGDYARLWSGRTRNVDAYLKYLEAISLIARQTRAANIDARKVAVEVIELDPRYPRGYVALAQTHLWDILLGISESPQRSLELAMASAQKARDLDGRDPAAVGVLASSHLMARLHDRAIELVGLAVDLDPHAADSRLRQGFVLLNSGRPASAIEVILDVGRRSPNVYFQPYYYLHLATAYRLAGRYDDAIRTAAEAVGRLPDNLLIRLQLAAAYQQAGRTDEARAQASEVMRIDPAFALERYRRTLYYRDRADIDRILEALRNTGLS